jgi:hypothetical protein
VPVYLLTQILAISLIAAILYGWGYMFYRVLLTRSASPPVVLATWVGFCIVLSVTEFLHVFVAIDWQVGTAIGCLGFIGAVHAVRCAKLSLMKVISSQVRSQPVLWSLLAVLVMLSCLRTLEVPSTYDAGLYHFGSIRWVNEYPIVPGLGNLHWRLALNQSYFSFLALLNFFPIWGKGYATGSLFLIALTTVTVANIAAYQSKIWRLIFLGILLPYVYLLSLGVANPSPDTAVALIEIVLFVYIFVLFSKNPLASARRAQLAIGILFLCIAIITVKLSSIAFGIACAVLVLGQQFFIDRHYPMFLWKTLVVLFVFLVIHLLRGYLLSGAPFFPNSFGGQWSLPWAVHPGVASFESELIYAWARQPGISLSTEMPIGFAWIPRWFGALPTSVVVQFIVFTIMATLNLLRHFRTLDRPGSHRTSLLYFPLFISIVFWFFTAPDPRFLGAVLILGCAFSTWHFMASSNLAIIRNVLDFSIPHRLSAIALSMLIIFLLMRLQVFDGRTPHEWATIPRSDVIEEVTKSGLEIYTPREGAQCWDAPLPCAVAVHPDLKKKSLILFSFLGVPVGYSLMFYKN